jgi:hypothetical protein
MTLKTDRVQKVIAGIAASVKMMLSFHKMQPPEVVWRQLVLFWVGNAMCQKYLSVTLIFWGLMTLSSSTAFASGPASDASTGDGYRGVTLYQIAAPAYSGLQAQGRSQRTFAGQTTTEAQPPSTPGFYNALLFSGTPGAASNPVITNLNPTGFDQSVVQATDGIHQVGFGSSTTLTGGNMHALLWNGTPGSYVDLNPSQLGVTSSYGEGVAGNEEVANGDTASGTIGLLFTGSAASAVNLTPTQLGATGSFVYNTDGVHQSGVAIMGNNGVAVVWTGTAGSAVEFDATAAGLLGGNVNGTGGNQEVGDGGASRASNGTHAVLWNGTAASAIDLTPTIGLYAVSQAMSTNGSQQVGYIGNPYTAGTIPMVWSGTAASGINLLSDLGPNYTGATANSIDPAGDVFGLGMDTNGNTFAVEWVPVPEPAFASVLMTVVAGAMVRRRCQGDRDTNR